MLNAIRFYANILVFLTLPFFFFFITWNQVSYWFMPGYKKLWLLLYLWSQNHFGNKDGMLQAYLLKNIILWNPYVTSLSLLSETVIHLYPISAIHISSTCLSSLLWRSGFFQSHQTRMTHIPISEAELGCKLWFSSLRWPSYSNLQNLLLLVFINHPELCKSKQPQKLIPLTFIVRVLWPCFFLVRHPELNLCEVGTNRNS